MEAQGGGCRTNVNKDNNNENGNGRKIETGAGKKKKTVTECFIVSAIIFPFAAAVFSRISLRYIQCIYVCVFCEQHPDRKKFSPRLKTTKICAACATAKGAFAMGGGQEALFAVC